MSTLHDLLSIHLSHNKRSKMKLKNWKLRSLSFLEFDYKLLNFLGMWRRDGISTYHFLSAMHFAASGIFLIAIEIIFMYQNVKTNFKEFMKTFGTVHYHIICVSRLVWWLSNKSKISKLIEKLDRKSILPRYFHVFHGNREEVNEKCIFAYWIANLECFGLFVVFTVFSQASLAFSYISALFMPVGRFDNRTNATLNERQLPYSQWHYLNADSSDLSFMFEFIFQFYSIDYLTIAFLGTDTFIFGLLINIRAQIKIVGLTLRAIKLRKGENEANVTEQLHKCISEINEIAQLMSMFEDLMCFATLCMQSLAIQIIFSIILIIPTETEPVKMFGYFLFVLTVTCEIFINAWYTQSVRIAFAQLSDDIYSINWDEASGCFRRKLAFAMSRCQKPMRITIGKFADADISSAISVRYIRETILPLRLSGINFQVVKMAYSFRTLLSNIKMKN